MSNHSFGCPLLDAAYRELLAIHRETGGGDGLRPNTSPEYQGAKRVWRAILDQRDAITSDRLAYRFGEKQLRAVT